MPVIERKKTAPPEPPPAPAKPPASAPLTAADVQLMLAARDEVWMRQLQAVTTAFSGALKSSPTQEKAPHGWEFKVDYIPGSFAVKTIRATPVIKSPKE